MRQRERLGGSRRSVVAVVDEESAADDALEDVCAYEDDGVNLWDMGTRPSTRTRMTFSCKHS